MLRTSLKTLALVLSLFGVAHCAMAATPSLFSGRAKVEADSKKDYMLTESAGNWFVMAKKFSGDDAALQAKRLVYEFRASRKMNAYVFKFDPDQMEMDALSQNLGKTKKFHYQTARAVEYAVLVGGYATGEDPALQRDLEMIRKFSPVALQKDPQSKAIAERFKEGAKRDSKYAGYGPLGGATPVPNPLMPAEYFNHKGVVDPFVAKLNSDSPYSLLNNKKTYTVRIATFSGDTSMKKSSEKFDDLNGRLKYAGLRAAALCEALRNSGVEAWEFHDRDCSFVTVGSFDKYGELQPDGHIELDPRIGAIMKKYGGALETDADGATQYKSFAVVVEIPDPESTKLNPKKKTMKLVCDLRPIIIVVPQRSGEENVAKIALAQETMKRAQQKKEERFAEESLREAEEDIMSVKNFSNSNRVMTEEELKALDPDSFARMQAANVAGQNAQTSQTAQKANVNPRYAESNDATAKPTARPATARPSLQASTTQTAARPGAQPTAASQSVAKQNSQRQTSTVASQNAAQSTKTQKTARRAAAPTY